MFCVIFSVIAYIGIFVLDQFFEEFFVVFGPFFEGYFFYGNDGGFFVPFPYTSYGIIAILI